MKNFKFEDEAEDVDILAEDDLDLVEDTKNSSKKFLLQEGIVDDEDSLERKLRSDILSYLKPISYIDGKGKKTIAEVPKKWPYEYVFDFDKRVNIGIRTIANLRSGKVQIYIDSNHKTVLVPEGSVLQKSIFGGTGRVVEYEVSKLKESTIRKVSKDIINILQKMADELSKPMKAFAEAQNVAQQIYDEVYKFINKKDGHTERLDVFINTKHTNIIYFCLYDPFGDYRETVLDIIRKYQTKYRNLDISWVSSQNELYYSKDPEFIRIR